jgi:hypothetical protein
MKTALIVLGFIFYFGFKVYKNFKLEMDKAKVRANSQKNNDSAAETKEQFNAKEHLETKKVESMQRKNDLNALKNKKLSIDYYNPEIPSEEVVNGRLIHEPHKHGFLNSEPEHAIETHFDLRQAIIQQAILERPKL